MNFEKNSQKPVISKKDKELIDKNFRLGNKIYEDVLNLWMPMLLMSNSVKSLDCLRPIGHYEDYLQEIELNYPGIYDYVMSLSDIAFVTAFNKLIDQFNDDIARIKAEQDFDAIKKYVHKAREIVRGQS